MTPTILSLISLLVAVAALVLGAVEWKRGFPVTRHLMAAVGIDWGGPQIALVNVVNVFGVDSTGATDAGPKLQAAFNALAATGQPAYFPPGTYKIVTPVNLPNNLIVWGSPGTVIQSALTGSGNFAPWASNAALGATTTVTAANTPGTRVVQSATTFADGTILAVLDAAQLRGSVYTVVASTPSGGDFNLTLDRPVFNQFQIGDSIQVVTTQPSNIHIFGNGMKFSGVSGGTVTAYYETSLAYRIFVDNIVCDQSLGSLGSPSVGVNFDIGCVECLGTNIRVAGGGVINIGVAIQAGERVYFKGCELLNCVSAGASMFDCYDCGIEGDCIGVVGAEANGCQFVSNEAANAVGCTRCYFKGTTTGCTNGAGLAYGSSYCTVDIVDAYSVSSGVGIDNNNGPCVGNTINGTILGAQCGSGGAGILLSGAGHQFKSNRLEIVQAVGNGISITGNGVIGLIDNLTMLDCAGTTGDWVLVNGNSTTSLIVKNIDAKSTLAGIGVCGVFFAEGGANVCLDDFVLEQTGSGTICAVRAQSVANWRLRNLRPNNSHGFGVLANGGVAVVIRILEGCDFSLCGVGIDADATAQLNRGNVTTTTAISFPIAAHEKVLLQPNAATSAAYVSAFTAGSGFTIACAASTDYLVI